MEMKPIVGAALIAFVFAAGAWAAGQTDEGTTAADGAPVVRVLSGGWFGTDYNEVESTAILEERLGVDLQVTSTGWGDEYRQKQQVMMATGDFPEIMTIDANSVEQEYAESGALLPISQYFDEYPNIHAYQPDSKWEVMTHPDGNVYAVPTAWVFPDGSAITNFTMLTYRKDWLDKFGFNVPRTTDEYLEVARAFTWQDPDGNGEDDTFAQIGENGSIGTFVCILAAFGGGQNLWYDAGGRVDNLATSENTKAGLVFANTLWNEGVIDPEFLTDNRERWEQKWIGGVGGAVYTFGHMADKNDFDNYRSAFLAENPAGEWVFGEPLIAPGYEDVAPTLPKGSRRGWMRSAVLADSENPTDALRVIDYIVSPEGSYFFKYGIEGEHYELNPDGSVNVLASAEEKASFGIDLSFVPIVRPEVLAHVSAEYEQALKEWESYRIGDVTDMLLIPEVGEFNQILDDYVEEQFVRMIIGDIDIETGFPRFVEEFNRRGGDELRAALNAAYADRAR